MDVLQLVDGHWTPNGEGLVVSDVAGQFHLYGVGSAESMAYARYDQFFSSDYRPIRNDGDGRVLDEETGAEAHIRNDRRAPFLSTSAFRGAGRHSLCLVLGCPCVYIVSHSWSTFFVLLSRPYSPPEGSVHVELWAASEKSSAVQKKTLSP